MARYNGRYEFQVTDINGDTALVSFPFNQIDTTTLVGLATGLGNLEAALAAATNGKVTRQSVKVLFNEAQYLVGTSPPNSAEYSSVTDGAHFAFADGSGERTSATVPAPIAGLFGSNSNVVDSTVTAALNLIAAVAANCASPNGVAYNLYKGGVKTGRHSRKRTSRLIP